MKLAKLIALLGLIAMTVVLIYGFSVGDFSGEGAQLMSMPWGIVSLTDLYTGFILFSGWIIFREKSLLVAILWTVAILMFGFWAGSLYTLIALQTSNGDWYKFWMGKHVTKLH